MPPSGDSDLTSAAAGHSASVEFGQLQDILSRGAFEEVLPMLEDFVSLHPADGAALWSLGSCLLEVGRPQDALRHLSSALALDSRDTRSLNLVGKCLVRLNKHIDAADVFRHAVSVDKHCADSRNNLGTVLLELGRPSEALPHLRKATEIDPSHRQACVNLLNVLVGQKDYALAHEAIQALYVHNRAAEEFLAVCCDVYFQATMLALSERLARELVRHFPSEAACHRLNRSLLHQRKHDEFVRGTLDVARLYGDNPANAIHAVTVLSDSGDEQRARQMLDQALQDTPCSIEAHIALAYDRLRRLDFSSGWEAYEHRLRQRPGQVHYEQTPNWDGSDLRQRRVLVLAEQGIGDVILYSRFLLNLLIDADRVCMLCEPRIRVVLEATFPEVTFISDPTLIPVLDCQVSIALGSLARLYAVDLDHIQQCSARYIRANDRLKEDWASHLRRHVPPGQSLVAVSLGAGTDDYNRLKRTCPFPAFLNLWPVKPMTLIDIDHDRGVETYEKRRAEAKADGIELISFEGVNSALEQLCALISQLDLVITTQQTNAHICGAMGTPCIVMLPRGPHFVYGSEGDSTPWYPSLHLIRLNGWHEWEGLGDAMLSQLKQLSPEMCESRHSR